MASCKSEIHTFAYLSKGTGAPHTKMYTTSETIFSQSFMHLNKVWKVLFWLNGAKSFVDSFWGHFCLWQDVWIVTRIYKTVSLVSNASEGHLLQKNDVPRRVSVNGNTSFRITPHDHATSHWFENFNTSVFSPGWCILLYTNEEILSTYWLLLIEKKYF